MRIDPALRALREDAGPQRRAQAALEMVREKWRGRSEVAGILDELTCYGSGAGLANCPRLMATIGDRAAATAFLDPLTGDTIAALRDHPFGQVAFRHQYASGVSVLLLAESGRATLSLVTYECERSSGRVPAQSVCFTDGERHECFLGGQAAARLFTLSEARGASARLEARAIRLRPGSTLHLIGRKQAKLIDRVEGRLVMLRLSRVPIAPLATCEYRLSDGELLHRAGADRRESREEMMMALLGRMGRSDAAAAVADIAMSGSAHLRWQAVRQYLALDAAKGIALLSNIALDGGDELAPAATALRARLLADHPRLAAEEVTPCPA